MMKHCSAAEMTWTFYHIMQAYLHYSTEYFGVIELILC